MRAPEPPSDDRPAGPDLPADGVADAAGGPEPVASAGTAGRIAPGLATLLAYRREWLARDVLAGLALTAVLIPVGMGYAVAAGLPAIHGLYATIAPLAVYALLGPSRIMVLGPDSTLTAVIAATVLPLAAGGVERAVALAGVLALLTGVCQALIGVARLGRLADLFSKPIRIGFLNAIALTVMLGQLPRLLGVEVDAQTLFDRIAGLAHAALGREVDPLALAVGGAVLATILAMRRWLPRWPGVLLAVAGATIASGALELSARGLEVLGPLPQGLPAPSIPRVGWSDLPHLLPGAVAIALLSFADTSVLSRSLAARGGYRVDPNREMLALGAANLATGLLQGFPISSSASRTPVAEAAGSRTQLTGLVGAATIVALLLLAPGLLADLPQAALAAVVITACLSFADVRGMLSLWRLRRVEFALSMASFLGVALVGVIEGIGLAIMLSMAVVVWKAWHPYRATLVRVDGRKGYHDASRHPEGRAVPGLVIFRWDAPLFFANAELFRDELLGALVRAGDGTRMVLVAADAITDVDVTAADVLVELDRALQRRGVDLHFAGLKGPVKDRLARLGLSDRFGGTHYEETVGSAVNRYRERYRIDWRDWDES
jgi:high affinity sulfate transporter 1